MLVLLRFLKKSRRNRAPLSLERSLSLEHSSSSHFLFYSFLPLFFSFNHVLQVLKEEGEKNDRITPPG